MNWQLMNTYRKKLRKYKVFVVMKKNKIQEKYVSSRKKHQMLHKIKTCAQIAFFFFFFFFFILRKFSVDRRDQKLIKFGLSIARSLFHDKHIDVFMTSARRFNKFHVWLTLYLPTKSALLKILRKTIEGLLCNVSSSWKYSLKRKRYLISILLEIWCQVHMKVFMNYY